MKTLHLFFFAFFLKFAVGPDLAGSSEECRNRLQGFCFPAGLDCPECFGSYGHCSYDSLQCCAKICADATPPPDVLTLKTTAPPSQTDLSQKDPSTRENA